VRPPESEHGFDRFRSHNVVSMAKQREPRFHGLFMGVDRYASPEIQELRYTEQDAIALHALFADNLGDGVELLIGSGATRAEIERRLQQLAQVNPDPWKSCASSDQAARATPRPTPRAQRSAPPAQRPAPQARHTTGDGKHRLQAARTQDSLHRRAILVNRPPRPE
jgi:hypothetical protein